MKKYQLLSILLCFFVFNESFGQRGIFFELEENQKVLQKNFKLIYNSASKLPLVANKELKRENIKIAPAYLSWIFFTSNSQYTDLFVPGDLCRFSELAANKLIKITDRIIFEVNFDIEESSEKTQKKTYGFFKLDQLIAFLKNQKICPNLDLFSESFNDENLSITTSSYELKKPTNEQECETAVKKIKQDPMVAFFCGKAEEVIAADMAIVELDTNGINLNTVQKNALNKKIQRGLYIRNKVGELEASLMGQICQNLNSPQLFCAPHLREDIWTKASNGEFSLRKVSQVCSNITNGKVTNKKDLKRCAEIASDMPSSCAEVVRQNRSGLFPVSDCHQLSRNLIRSNLETDFLDCPSEIDNHLFINAQRIASNTKQMHTKYKNKSCKNLPSKVYSNISFEYDSENWPLNICYFDPADADDLKICTQNTNGLNCIAYDPDAPINSDQSAKIILESILKESFNDGKKVVCQFFEKAELDKYLYSSSNNCLVYHEKKNCNFLNCPKTILLNGKKVSEVSFSKRELRCLPYIPGNDEDNAISESRVISGIVRRIYATSNKLMCKIIPEKKYNPIFLEYKQGCFILSPQNCQSYACRKRIIYNQKEFFNFEYQGKLGENYFEISSQDKIHSMNRKLKKVLDYEEEKILSLTKMKLWFKNGKRLIHGVGCLEDLYPDFFRRNTFNQCDAIPFLISGTHQKNSTEYVFINTTLDLITYPRSIRWNNLYSALKMYQHIHPYKLWALYGIK